MRARRMAMAGETLTMRTPEDVSDMVSAAYTRGAERERARIAAKMRADYPTNRHALEWADWILRESVEQKT
jgi:hypothetical protein